MFRRGRNVWKTNSLNYINYPLLLLLNSAARLFVALCVGFWSILWRTFWLYNWKFQRFYLWFKHFDLFEILRKHFMTLWSFLPETNTKFVFVSVCLHTHTHMHNWCPQTNAEVAPWPAFTKQLHPCPFVRSQRVRCRLRWAHDDRNSFLFRPWGNPDTGTKNGRENKTLPAKWMAGRPTASHSKQQRASTNKPFHKCI